MSAAAEGQRIFGFGVGTISPANGIAALERVMGGGLPQVLVLRMDWSRFVSMVPGASTDPFLERIRSGLAAPAGETGGREAGAALVSLLAAPAEERHAMLERFVQTELAKVLELEPDDLPLDQPLNTVGLDSLMALELKNRVEVSLSITLPIVSLIQGPTITQLAEDLLARVEAAAETSGAGGAPAGTGSGSSAATDGTPSAEWIATLLSRSTGSKRRTET